MTDNRIGESKEKKKEIRRTISEQRLALKSSWRTMQSLVITEKAIQLGPYRDAAVVSTYVNLAREVETTELIGNIIQDKGFVALPRLDSESDAIVLHKVDRFPEGFVVGKFGLSEPSPEAFPETIEVTEVDVMFMPALAVDLSGNRLGYGQGYYDRLLARRPPVFKAAIAYDFQVVETLPEEEHDIRLNAAVTEKQTLVFSVET